ncbi:MAG: AzlD domain-containing protein [Azospirillaceae bacterium]
MAASLPLLATLAGMAAATASTRLAGAWLASRLRPGGRAVRLLEAVPGIVLAALVAPTALATGGVETAACGLAALLAWRAPAIVAVIGAVALAAGLRGAGL